MSHHHGHEHRRSRQDATRKLPVKWTAIAVVALMLAAMLLYVFSIDDSLVPDEPVQERVPAAAP